MSSAARAIVIYKDQILVMYRRKRDIEYYTLVGGKIDAGETAEQAVIREVSEETQLKVTSHRLVYTEKFPAPYNDQYIFLCEVENYNEVALSPGSEEEELNKMGENLHKPMWISLKQFSTIPFRSPSLQDAINKAVKDGFPEQPLAI